jgi:hypothetical protein
MILTVYWRECSVERGRSKQPVRCLHWAEYGFTLMPLEAWRSNGYGHYRGASVGVPVSVPFGSRVVRRIAAQGEVDRLVTHFDPHGLGAETVAWLAIRGARGFSIPKEAYIVAKKRPAGPSLFGDEAETNGAYGNGAAILPAVYGPAHLPGVHEAAPATPLTEGEIEVLVAAASVAGEYHGADARRIAELEEAIRRAIGFHRQEMFETARTVLEGVITLEPTP